MHYWKNFQNQTSGKNSMLCFSFSNVGRFCTIQRTCYITWQPQGTYYIAGKLQIQTCLHIVHTCKLSLWGVHKLQWKSFTSLQCRFMAPGNEVLLNFCKPALADLLTHTGHLNYQVKYFGRFNFCLNLSWGHFGRN